MLVISIVIGLLLSSAANRAGACDDSAFKGYWKERHDMNTVGGMSIGRTNTLFSFPGELPLTTVEIRPITRGSGSPSASRHKAISL